jgi:hypothetical protein
VVTFVWGEIPELNSGSALETVSLEYWRGSQNSWCSGEMRRDQEEYQRRRRRTGQ